jgi:hypothetical protein
MTAPGDATRHQLGAGSFASEDGARSPRRVEQWAEIGKIVETSERRMVV